MTLSELQATLYARLGFSAATVDAVVIARLLSYMNETQRSILSRKGMTRLRRAILPFSSVAGSPYAVLPRAAVQVFSIRDAANRLLVGPISLADVRYEDPGLAFSSSVPYGWTLINLAAAAQIEPVSSSSLFVFSSNAADGATKKVFIEGVDYLGLYRSDSAILNGVTPVSLSALYVILTKCYLALAAGGATTAAGEVTITQGSGGSVVTVITTGSSSVRFTKIQLYPTPSAALTYSADVELHIQPMTQATDEPYLPEDFHDLLIIGSLMKEYSRREKPVQYAEELAQWKIRISELRSFVGSFSGEGRRADVRRGFSQFGANYPAGS